jgi:endonuclease/exonuclease/phosphatase family metal-dependent hydrolase
MKTLVLILMFTSLLFGEKILKIATYNVENLFDLNSNSYRYEEFKPNTKSLWNKKNYKIKLQNISKVIKEIDADIIALQEIGSLEALKDLRYTLKQKGLYYQYFKIADKKPTTIKVAILSKIPFVYTKELAVTSSYEYRNILEVKFKIASNDLYMFVNHWKSKGGPESMRIVSAKKLIKRVKEIGHDKNIIILGDLNSDYQEYKIFKRKRKHNDTYGKTGINHVLKTIKQNSYAKETKYQENNFYNLWYDTQKQNRYSYIYRGKKEALDNIIISQSLLGQSNNIHYIYNSITNYAKPYLFKKKKYIYRWQITRGKIRKHKGKGYSDHLAVIAKFTLHSSL